jgi:hypothetical protein
MEVIARVFDNYNNALEAVGRLREIGINERRLALLAAGHATKGTATSLPVSDSENPGTGTAMGAAVGGAMGAAGGATLGLAAATLLVPGVGPVLAFGLIGAALLGGTGAVVGAKVGDTIEEELGEGFPHEEIYLFEDALRHGKSVVVAYATEGTQADEARDIMTKLGSVSLDSLREAWWAEQRDREWTDYQSNGRDFPHDELSYRRGFEAAFHPLRRGKSYSAVESDLKEAYGDVALDSAFRRGYERGVAHQNSLTEKQKV